MDKKKQLIILEIVLIVILLIFCIILEFRKSDFKRDCKETFNLNNSCPCNSPKITSNFNLNNFNNILNN